MKYSTSTWSASCLGGSAPNFDTRLIMVSSVSSTRDNVGDDKVGDDKVISTAMEASSGDIGDGKMGSVKGEMWVIMVG